MRSYSTWWNPASFPLTCSTSKNDCVNFSPLKSDVSLIVILLDCTMASFSSESFICCVSTWTFLWLPMALKKFFFKFACLTGLSFPFLPHLSLPLPQIPRKFPQNFLPLSFLLLLPVPRNILALSVPCHLLHQYHSNATSSLSWAAHCAPWSRLWIKWLIMCPSWT